MEFFEVKIGFSTGSIALNDVKRGVSVATHRLTRAIELSALREDELDPLLETVDRLKTRLSGFDHIAFHAPSKRVRFSESELTQRLRKVADRGWAIIVHPDVIEDFSLWRTLGGAICVENMDKRKPMGRTAAQLKEIFAQLPQARLCFDIGHARQVDPTMQEAETILERFHNRMGQVHMSYVNSQSRHERLNFESIAAFQKVARWLGSTPIILETPVTSDEVEEEVIAAKKVFKPLRRRTEAV